jgi:hypothetical protein
MSDHYQELKAEAAEGNKILDLQWSCPNRECKEKELFDRKTGYHCMLCATLLETESEFDLLDCLDISYLLKQNCGLLSLTINEIYNFTIKYNESLLGIENYQNDILDMD